MLESWYANGFLFLPIPTGPDHKNVQRADDRKTRQIWTRLTKEIGEDEVACIARPGQGRMRERMFARLESGRGPICHKCVELEEYVGGSESVVSVFGRSFDGD